VIKDDQEESILIDVTNTLKKIISERPDYGVIGLSCYFLGGKLQRIVTTKEISILKPTPASAGQ